MLKLYLWQFKKKTDKRPKRPLNAPASTNVRIDEDIQIPLIDFNDLDNDFTDDVQDNAMDAIAESTNVSSKRKTKKLLADRIKVSDIPTIRMEDGKTYNSLQLSYNEIENFFKTIFMKEAFSSDSALDVTTISSSPKL
jgi:hypothetical protein